MKDTDHEVGMTQDTENNRYYGDGTMRDPSDSEIALFHRAGHISKLFLLVMLGVLPNLLMLTVIL